MPMLMVSNLYLHTYEHVILFITVVTTIDLNQLDPVVSIPRPKSLFLSLIFKCSLHGLHMLYTYIGIFLKIISVSISVQMFS